MSHAAPTCALDRPKPAVSVARPLAIDRLPQIGTWARTGAIASWLIAQGLGPESAPVAILSDKSPENPFGALRAGVRVASLSTGYLTTHGDVTQLSFPQAIIGGSG